MKTNVVIKIVTVFSIVLLCQETYCQFSFSIEGGGNISTIKMSGVEEADEEPFLGYYIGISPRYSINKFAIVADVNYSYRGYELGNKPFLDKNSKFKNTYIIIAPQIEYRIHKSIGIGLGFYAGFEVNEAQKLPGFSEYKWVSTKEIDTILSPDYGINLGVKYYFKRIYIKTLFDLGIRNVWNTELKAIGMDGEELNLKVYKRSFQLGIGYLI